MKNSPKDVASARTWFCAALIALAAFLWIEDTFSYEFDGERWVTDYHYSFGAGCDHAHRVSIEVALYRFAPVTYHRESDTSLFGFAEDGVSMIYCSDVEPPFALTSPGMMSNDEYITNSAGAIVGKAQWWWPTDAREIAECDIWLSTFIEGNELQAVATHEIGHCWGLRHSGDGAAVMASIPGSSRPTLDDMTGLAHLYGNCGAVQIDHTGKMFFPAIDSRTLLRGIDDPQLAEFQGKVISGYMDLGTDKPLIEAIYGIAESKCYAVP